MGILRVSEILALIPVIPVIPVIAVPTAAGLGQATVVQVAMAAMAAMEAAMAAGRIPLSWLPALVALVSGTLAATVPFGMIPYWVRFILVVIAVGAFVVSMVDTIRSSIRTIRAAHEKRKVP